MADIDRTAKIARLSDEIQRLTEMVLDLQDKHVACGLELIRLTEENSELNRDVTRLRAILVGRPTPPTDAEIDAHEKAGGRWLYRTAGRCPYTQETQRAPLALAEACRMEGKSGRWWPLDGSGAPCAWPVVTGVDRG